MKWMKSAALNRKPGRCTVLGKELFLGSIQISPARISVGEEVEDPVDGPQVSNSLFYAQSTVTSGRADGPIISGVSMINRKKVGKEGVITFFPNN